MSREPVIVRPRVAPDPDAQARLEERQRNVQPPAEAVLHRDRFQSKQRRTKAAESWPMLLRKQAW